MSEPLKKQNQSNSNPITSLTRINNTTSKNMDRILSIKNSTKLQNLENVLREISYNTLKNSSVSNKFQKHDGKTKQKLST